jgi:hypothetical protein
MSRILQILFLMQTRTAMYVERNIKGLSGNNCCSGKEISITYSDCLFVALDIQHARRMSNIIISVLCGSTDVFDTVP